MNGFEFNPSRWHECAEPTCHQIIVDGFCYRLNAHEVLCLECYTAASICRWQATVVYDKRAKP